MYYHHQLPKDRSELGSFNEPKSTPCYKAKMPRIKITPYTTYRQKWTAVKHILGSGVKDYCEAFHHLMQIHKVYPDELIELIHNIENTKMNENYPEMFKELRVISEVFDVPFHNVLYVNFGLEIFTTAKMCCISLFRDENGHIQACRNLDFFLWKQMSDILVQFDYYDFKGNIQYSYQSFAGTVLTHAGIKYGKYTLMMSQRSVSNHQGTIEAIKNGSLLTMHIFVKMLEKCDTYESVVEFGKKQALTIDVYLAFGGLSGNEGIMIQRNRTGIDNFVELDDDRWFIIQTNSDIEVRCSEGRREKAIEQIQEIAQGNKFVSMKQYSDQIATQFPVFHSLSISVTQMSAKDKKCQSFIFKPIQEIKG